MNDIAAAHTVAAGPTPEMKPPRLQVGALAWLRDNLFSTIGNTILTLLGALFIYVVLKGFITFAIIDATWTGADGTACAKNDGACWPFVWNKLGQFFNGNYPEAERWRVYLVYALAIAGFVPLLLEHLRPAAERGLATFARIATGVAFVLFGWLFAGFLARQLAPLAPRPDEIANFKSNPIVATATSLFGGIAARWEAPSPASVVFERNALHVLIGAVSIAAFALAFLWLYRKTRGAAPRVVIAIYAFLAFPILAFALLIGGVAGLEYVPTHLWGGLMLTLVVASTGIVAAFPLGICLALGRRSKMPFVKGASVAFIEFVRGVPLITILFMSSVMLPLFLPPGWDVDKLLRALIMVSLFSAAYLAEVVRGGLQAIPRGQFEAADALGLSYRQKMSMIVLPQALKLVVPNIVNSFIGLFKDTSLVLIIGLFDLLNVVQKNMSDQKWFAPTTVMTGYLFAGFLFWVFCFSMSRYSLSVERRLAAGDRK